MASLEKYFNLMKDFPDLFSNPDEPGVIRIISNPNEIRDWQEDRKKELAEKHEPLEWAEIGVLVDDPWFWIIRDLVEFPGGRRNGYIREIDRNSLGGGFGVVMMTMQDGNILLIKKFMHNDRQWYWEFPRGFGEPGLSAEENARKELREELGVEPIKLTKLSKKVMSRSKGGIAYFLAELPSDSEIKLQTSEGIADKIVISLEEFENWLAEGKITDRFTIKAYALMRIRS